MPKMVRWRLCNNCPHFFKLEFLGKKYFVVLSSFKSSQPKAFTARVFPLKKLLSSRLKKSCRQADFVSCFRASLRKLPTFFSSREQGRTKVCESRYSAHWRKITFRMKSPEDSLNSKSLQRANKFNNKKLLQLNFRAKNANSFW